MFSGDCREITNAFTVLFVKNKVEINISARTLGDILVIFSITTLVQMKFLKVTFHP